MAAETGQFLSSLLTANNSTQAMQAAVRHVVAVVQCDISWTGVVKADAEMHIGAHHGLQTPEMAADWHLAVGEGIGGKAASLQRTQKSSNYLHDSRRVPAKRLIDNEKIGSVLVSPLMAHDAALGVLYAADRRQRNWTSEDIDELESIADHLSVRLAQLDRVRLAEARASDARRRAEAADSHLTSAIELVELLSSASAVNHALDAVAVYLNARIELHDRHNSVIGASGPDRASCHGVEISSRLSPQSRLTVHLSCVDEDTTLTEPSARIALHALKLQLLRLCERSATIETLRGDLQEKLLTGNFTNSAHIQRRLALIGCSPIGSDARVIVIRARDQADQISERFHSDLRTTFPDYLVDHRDESTVVIIGNGGSEEELSLQIADLLGREEHRRKRKGTAEGSPGDSRRFVAGIGRRTEQLHEVSISYDEARAACTVGMSNPQTSIDGFASARALGLQGLASIPNAQLQAMVTDTFGPIIAHDERHGTHYMTTISSYLANDRHLGDTAAELHVHYNTVRNRIARIEELLDLSFARTDDRYRAETAVRMAAVLAARTTPTTAL
ncbi:MULTISPECIES: helix-turn-helix domain-containing protein [Brevibacterium]